MEALIAFIPPPFQPYFVAAGVLWATFTALAAVTPTKKDDKIITKLDKLGAIFDRLGTRIKNPK